MVLPIGISDRAAAIIEQMTERRVHLVCGFLPRPMQPLAWVVLLIAHYGYVRNSKEHIREVLHEEGPERKGFAGFVIGR